MRQLLQSLRIRYGLIGVRSRRSAASSEVMVPGMVYPFFGQAELDRGGDPPNVDGDHLSRFVDDLVVVGQFNA